MLIGAVAGITLLGLAFRLATVGQSLLGDELSTYWILRDSGLGDVLSSIRSDDEITPPLYFVLAWLSLQIDPSPEMIRLPSIIAGTATIPLIYALGLRTVGRGAGLVAAAVMALSPFMIYYSTDGRSYAVMIALLVASTLALLAALRSGRTRWWVVYAACSCGALYAHYTSVFPLAAQFVWVLWAHREAARALVLANLAVLAGFAPWIPGFIADNNSPTTEILSSLQPFTFDAVSRALGNWAIGYPYVELGVVPGTAGWALIAAGLAIAAAIGLARAWSWLRRSRLRFGSALRRVPEGVVLVALLALATPVGEAVYSAFGPDLLGARSLNPGWPGLALAIGAIVTAPGVPISLACAALVLSGFAIGAAKTLGTDVARTDYAGMAAFIEERWAPGDVVVDGVALTPVPLTGLDTYLPQTHKEYRLGLPITDEPFQIGDPEPSAPAQLRRAFDAAQGNTMFLLAYQPSDLLSGDTPLATAARLRGFGTQEVGPLLPPGFEITDEETFSGVTPVTIFRIEQTGDQ